MTEKFKEMREIHKNTLLKHKTTQSVIDLVKSMAGSIVVQITGGFIVDVIEGRTPKDVDVVVERLSEFETALLNNGFTFVSDTVTARTFQREFTIQILKKGIACFDFVISQSTLSIRKPYGKEADITTSLVIDETSFVNKILIPVRYDKADYCFSSLARIPHWEKKGYKIPDKTYLSLLRKLMSYTRVTAPPVNS